MARRLPQGAMVGENKDGEAEAQEAPMPGGTPGVEVSAIAAAHVPHLHAAPDPEELAKLPKPKVFKVTNGGRVVQGGMPTLIRPGARVSEATHDLAMLKHQGITMEEIIQ